MISPGRIPEKMARRDEKLFAQAEYFENLLDLFGGEHFPRTWSGNSGREERFSGVQIDQSVLKRKP
jgi:hypothetical protein